MRGTKGIDEVIIEMEKISTDSGRRISTGIRTEISTRAGARD